jgi:hypothetical protein
MLPARYPAHPALKFLKWMPVLLVVGLFHPESNTLLAGLGQIMLYISIFAPLAWVAGCRPDPAGLRKILFILWMYNLASAATGVLQVYFPGTFEGSTSSVIAARETFQRGDADVVLSDGTHILRPFGLTDVPGGAAAGGLNAIILGAGMLLTDKRFSTFLTAAAGMLIGVFIIFLSQLRVELVMAGICAVVLLVALLRQAELKSALVIGGLFLGVAITGSIWAFSVGGTQTMDRFSTLTADNPAAVYSANRGFFLDNLFQSDLTTYPLGAGLGRWGMMNFYFGDKETQLYSEIMWTSWLYDGGIPLILLYLCAFGAAFWVCWKLAMSRSGEIGLWSAVIFAYNAAILAGTFVFPVFAVQAGLEAWLINACLFSAALGSTRRVVRSIAAQDAPSAIPQFRKMIGWSPSRP